MRCMLCGVLLLVLQSAALLTPAKHLHPGFTSATPQLPTLSWALHLESSHDTGDQAANDLAAVLGLVNEGQIGGLQGYYRLSHPEHLRYNRKQSVLTADHHVWNSGSLHWPVETLDRESWETILIKVHSTLDDHPHVISFTQQVVRPRQKRGIVFSDPEYKHQWHLHNHQTHGMDVNIARVWERNITGWGIVTAVVDDGLEWSNPDLVDNYSYQASYDLNNGQHNPMPSTDKPGNHHGTRCAGEIAAAANGICGVGVAYNAKIGGLKILDGPMTDSMEATAFTQKMDVVDVYSCSWGPDDNGQTVDGPHHLAEKGLHQAVDYGRQGYGSIFVVASGNGGLKDDNCNYDGYATSIYTVTVGAVDEHGSMPYYGEECASMLAVTFSSGDQYTRSIVTTDWTFHGGTGCTDSHTGTSAAAPLAAGMVALMLDVQPCLTWRDVQHIIVMAAKKVDIDVAHWYQNAAGLHHSHKHGFGLMDAWDLVNAAKTWEPVPWMTSFSSPEMEERLPIPGDLTPLTLTYSVTEELLAGYDLLSLEYVHVTLSLTHQRRGDIEIRLTCPSHTESLLAATRSQDESPDGFEWWTFGTVRCWGEAPQGTWTLQIWDQAGLGHTRGRLEKWQLRLYGCPMTPGQVKDKIRKVRESADGRQLYQNISVPCFPAPIHNKPYKPLSEKSLKLIVLISAFCLFSAILETLEYMLCYKQEKEEHKKLMAQVAEAYRLMRQRDQPITEHTSLLQAEEIPLEEITVYERDAASTDMEETLLDECAGGYEEIHGMIVDETPQALPCKFECSQGDHLGESYQSSDISSDKVCGQGDAKMDRNTSTSHQISLQYLRQHCDLPDEVLEQLTPEEISLNLGTIYGNKE